MLDQIAKNVLVAYLAVLAVAYVIGVLHGRKRLQAAIPNISLREAFVIRSGVLAMDVADFAADFVGGSRMIWRWLFS